MKNTSTISARKLAIFSSNVARHRKAAGVSKTEFAAHTSVSRDTIRRIETRPEGYVPSLSTIEALAKMVNVTPYEIVSKRIQFV